MTTNFVNPRFIRKAEAIARCGLEKHQFDALVTDGIFPKPIRRGVWDRKQFDHYLEFSRLPTRAVDAGFVYFMKMGDYIKIGWSAWPESRRASLQTSTPYDIIILGAFPGPQQSEGIVHRLFAMHRHKGEWFRIAPSLVAFIAWLKVAWRGHADLIPGELDNVIGLRGKSVESTKTGRAHA